MSYPTENLSAVTVGGTPIWLGASVVTEKVIKGAGSHRILLALAERDRSSKDMRKMLGAVNGAARFEAEYMGRLEAGGYVYRNGDLWSITVKGRQKCEELGDMAPKVDLRNVATSRIPIEHVELRSILTFPMTLRDGALDFQKYPSRRGDRLYYRDGRVEKVEDSNG